MSLVNKLDALLPQTQCGECGYPGCMPYAEALAAGSAPINRCPPGGVSTVEALGRILNVDATPFLPEARANTRAPQMAVIREDECIGCTKCIQACPVDAIIGAAKLMHTVLSHECTGCGLCIEPCPVDCIELTPLPVASYDKEQARSRFNARTIRLLRESHELQQAYRQKRHLSQQTADKAADKAAKQQYILQAMKRSLNKS